MRRASAIAWMTCVLACCTSNGVRVQHVPWRDTPYPEVPASLGDHFERRTFVAPDGSSLPYRCRAPSRIAAAARLPLVIVLHGSGAIGVDNEAQLGPFARAWAVPAIADRFPAIVAVPQVASRSANYAPWRDGELASTAGPSAPSLIAWLDDLVAQPGVDPDRVYVVGFSMGGSAALQLVLARPRTFAGALIFGGIAPARDLAQRALAVPTWFVHGDADHENPIGSVRAWTTALAANGATPRLVEFVGMDHRVPADTLLAIDWREWLFAQHRR